MATALDKARTVEERLDHLEKEVREIREIQKRNLPEFRAALKRIDVMRETIHSHGNSLMRLEKLGEDAAKANAATADSIGELVILFKGAKTASGIIRRWAPRIIPVLIGVAVGRGWITIEDGKSITSIFGFG
jgi:hypothetical protein